MGRTTLEGTRRSALILSILFLSSSCSAAVSFQWAFTNNSLAVASPVLTQCQTYSLTIINTTNGVNAFGVPPYYITAFKAGGIPTTSLLGSTPTNLSWTINQASGSSLLLSVSDSAEDAGGVDPPIYTVASGNAECLPSSASVDFEVTANVSGSVQTCEPMGFQINGNGQKPYKVSIAIGNSPVVSNVTLGPNDDQFTFSNHADTNDHFVVAVSDANGVWGTSSELFTSVASTKFTCVDSVSSSDGTSTSSLSTPTATSAGSSTGNSSSNHTTIIVAVVASVCATALLVSLALCFQRWRKRRELNNRKAEPAMLPDAWYAAVPVTIPSGYSDTGNNSYSSFYDPPMGTPASTKAAHLRSVNPSPSAGGSSTYIGPTLGNNGVRPGSSFNEGSTSSVIGRVGYDGSFHPASSALASGSKGSPYDNQIRRPPGVSSDWTVEPQNVVIQHEDAGAVQEIPPPYKAPEHNADTPDPMFLLQGSS